VSNVLSAVSRLFTSLAEQALPLQIWRFTSCWPPALLANLLSLIIYIAYMPSSKRAGMTAGRRRGTP